MAQTIEQFEKQVRLIVSQCSYPDYEFDLDLNRLRVRVHCPDGVCNETGARISWNGRWWYFEPGMDDTEIVQTLFLAIRVVLEHEARELFKFGGGDIFNSHTNVHDLWAVASRTAF